MCESTDRGNGHFNFLDLEFLFLFVFHDRFAPAHLDFIFSTCFCFGQYPRPISISICTKAMGIITFEFEFILYRRGGRSVDRVTEILYEMEWNILSPLLNKKNIYI